MTDLLSRLRSKANDLQRVDGETMKQWDQIRDQVECLKGSDLPRMNFESIIEDHADLMIAAIENIERLTDAIWEYGDHRKACRITAGKECDCGFFEILKSLEEPTIAVTSGQ